MITIGTIWPSLADATEASQQAPEGGLGTAEVVLRQRWGVRRLTDSVLVQREMESRRFGQATEFRRCRGGSFVSFQACVLRPTVGEKQQAWANQ